MNSEVLKEQIKRHEGEVLEVYKDSLGYLTLGVGHLIREDDAEYGEPDGTPVSQEVVDRYYDADFDKHVDETVHVCGAHDIDFDNLPENIQHVLVNMCFNLGAPRLSKFRKFIAAINDEQWIEASVEMMDSRWANQVGPRAERLKEIVLSQANWEHNNKSLDIYSKYSK